MGSASLLNSSDPGVKDSTSKEDPVDSNTEEEVMAGGKQKKRSLSESSEQPAPTRKMPKRSASAASKNLKEKSISKSDKSDLIETKKDQVVEEEFLAVRMTAGQEDGRPNRRITDFILHDESGAAQQLEMLEINDLFITGLILPLEASADKKKEQGVRCEGFGRIESWAISGYEEGAPVIWISTDIADYDCLKPAASYKKYYDQFFEKARACIELYKKLTKSAGGDPDISLDELLAGLARTMSGSKYFSGAASLKEFIISQGDFIYKQLIGLDMTLKANDKGFTEIPALAALRDESKNQANFANAQVMPSNATLRIGSGTGDEEKKDQMAVDEEDEDAKLARLLQEEEYWKSKKQRKNPRSSSSSNKFYIKINEDEIANDYPLPAYYKTSLQETDEFIVFDNDYDVYDTEDLPRSMLHNWALYNSDSRLISLELLPMKPCSEIDVTIFGSGVMTSDDGSGFNLDTEAGQSSSASVEQATDGIPIYLSAIKEWMIEFGSSMVFISIRTDMAWYRLGKPSKQYSPCVCSRNSSGGRRSRGNSLESSSTIGGRRRKKKQKLKVTSQKPFKLRTEQRGKMKEEQLMKKVKEILTEEEKMRIPIAQGLPWTIDEPECLLKPPVKESTKPIDVKLHSDLRAIDRPEFDHQLITETLGARDGENQFYKEPFV